MLDSSVPFYDLIEDSFHQSDCLFSDVEKIQISKLLQFHSQSESSSIRVPYNILVISDNDHKGEEFCCRTILSANDSRLFSRGFLLYSFDEYCRDNFSLSQRASRYDILAIHSIHEQDLEKEEWNKLEQELISGTSPDSVYKILCIDSAAASALEERNQHLFYRIFPDDYHVSLTGSITDDNIIFDSLLLELKKTLPNYSLTDAFQTDIHEYIQTVYPGANLRERAFVKDLTDRIIRSVFTQNTPVPEIDVSCVPFFHKRTSSNTVPSFNTVKDFFAVEESSLKKVGDPVKNVLILALSMFSGLQEKTYRDEETGYSCTGYYQLDPIPRFLINKVLHDKGETLDEIIMFCTPETLKPSKKELNHPDQSGLIECFTAADYFEWSLKKETLSNIRFTRINLNEFNPKDAISEVVDHLRSLKYNSDLRIFFDTHGGFRGIQIMTEAILSLLAHEDIHLQPEDVWTIYHSRDIKVEDIIRRDNEAYSIFSFVSGINEFVNYGRCSSLEKYLKMDQKHIQEQTSNSLIRCIREISDGIQLCNIPKFESGLDDIRACLSQIENASPDGAAEETTYLSLFTQVIEEDYTNLLVDQPEKRDVIDEADWCLKKGFLQQSLTLIESKAPSLLYSNRFQAIRYDDQVRNFLTEKKNELTSNKKSDPTLFLLNLKLGELLQNSGFEQLKIRDSKPDFFSVVVKVLDGLNKMKQFKSIDECSFITFRNNKKEDINKLDYHLKGQILPQLLCYHALFHSLRNKLNHASDNLDLVNLDNLVLETAIDRYLDLFRALQDISPSEQELLVFSNPQDCQGQSNSKESTSASHSKSGKKQSKSYQAKPFGTTLGDILPNLPEIDS